MTWYYKDQPFDEEQIGNHFGFVYLIENLKTGKKYVGKKFFTRAKTKQVKGKKKKTRVSSDWQAYFGSNAALVEEVRDNGTENYRRTILHLCMSRGECSYLELREQIDRRVLESDQYYNSWISARIRKDHIKTLQNTSS